MAAALHAWLLGSGALSAEERVEIVEAFVSPRFKPYTHGARPVHLIITMIK